MRFLLPLAALLIAVPAAAQQAPELGARTSTPQSHLPAAGLAPGQDDLAAAIAAAESHPLGSIENPIRVGGPEGERAYLFRLRCADGGVPRIGARGDGGVDAYGTLAAVYPVTCAAGTVQLHFDMYHEEHVENRAPAGFAIVTR
jgi:hypothetical protein